MEEPLVYLSSAGRWLIVGWMFIVGAAIGSFLNVVAYRLPRGLNLSHPGSRCPACGRAIRWHDNVPIFGWLWLRGRCRDCRAPISPRYPTVEAIVAASTVLVAWQGIGAAVEQGDVVYVLDPLWVGVRLVVLFVLFAAALLEWDGHVAPPKMLGVALLLVFGVTALFPGSTVAVPGEAVAIDRWQHAGFSVAAVLLLGLLVWPLVVPRGASSTLGAGAIGVAELALVGLALGTPGGGVAIALAAVLLVVGRAVGHFWNPSGRFGWAAWLVVGTLFWTAAAPAVLRETALPLEDPQSALLAAGAVVAVCSIVSRVLPRRSALPSGDA